MPGHEAGFSMAREQVMTRGVGKKEQVWPFTASYGQHNSLSTLKGSPQRHDDVLTPRTLFVNRVTAYGIGWSRCRTGAGRAHSFIPLVKKINELSFKK